MANSKQILTVSFLITLILLIISCKDDTKRSVKKIQKKSATQIVDLKLREGNNGPYRRVISGTWAIDSFPSFLKGIPAYDTISLQKSIFLVKTIWIGYTEIISWIA